MRMPSFAAAAPLALLLSGLPAAAGELIRYRGADGSVGFVDDEKRLPPGVEVVSRTPIERSAPAAPVADAAPAPDEPVDGEPAALEATTPVGDDTDCEALANLLERTRCRGAREAHCSHYGLSPRCKPDQIAAARDWCGRGEALRVEIAHLTDERDTARERQEECLRRGARSRRCDEEALEEAERAALVAERRVEALEEQCHDEGCLPGWVREGCAFEPGA
jgi:hypothetical protein